MDFDNFVDCIEHIEQSFLEGMQSAGPQIAEDFRQINSGYPLPYDTGHLRDESFNVIYGVSGPASFIISASWNTVYANRQYWEHPLGLWDIKMVKENEKDFANTITKKIMERM